MHAPRDEDCILDSEGACIVCGMFHGEPCAICGGRAYHRFGCPETGLGVVPPPPLGAGVLFVPWAIEGPNEFLAGRVVAARGLALQVASSDGVTFTRHVAAVLTVEQQIGTCACCEGWGTVLVGEEIQACDACGRFPSDQMAALAVIARRED